MRVCSVREQSLAGMVHSLLCSHGLHPFPLSTAGHISMAGADQCYYIEVPKEEVESAKQVLMEAGHKADLLG